MTQKSVATSSDLAMYQRLIDDDRYVMEVNGRTFLLDRENAQDSLNAEENDEAKADHPFWDTVNNTPLKANCLDVVDYRPGQSPVKDQLDRGTCVCFASLANLEALILAQGQLNVTLSEQYANWLFMKMQGQDQCDDTLRTTLAAQYLSKHGVCVDTLCAYEDLLTVQQHCATDPSVQAKTGSSYGIDQYTLIDRLGLLGPSIANPDYLEALLCHGYDVVFGTSVAWVYPNPDNIYDVILDKYGNPLQSRGGHAMVIVGFNRGGAIPYFIVKNSWGTSIGVNGYYYLSYDYIRTYAKYGYIVQQIRADMSTSP